VILRRREQAELGEHVPDVGLHRLGRHEQLGRDRRDRRDRPPRSADATLTLDGFFGWPLRLSA
jgi:hypothetical protein